MCASLVRTSTRSNVATFCVYSTRSTFTIHTISGTVPVKQIKNIRTSTHKHTHKFLAPKYYDGISHDLLK